MTTSVLLTLNEVRERLNVSFSTVRRLVDSGELPSVKVGSARKSPRRVRECDLAAFIRSHIDTQ